MSLGLIYALIGIAIASGLGAIGSCIGVGSVATTGSGLLSKEPKKFPQVLIMCALPSTQALYGLLFGFIIMIRTGLLGGDVGTITENVGLAYLFASLPVAIACLASGIFQGRATAAGVKILAEKPENFTQAVVLASLIESFAIFGLVISLLVVFVGIGN